MKPVAERDRLAGAGGSNNREKTAAEIATVTPSPRQNRSTHPERYSAYLLPYRRCPPPLLHGYTVSASRTALSTSSAGIRRVSGQERRNDKHECTQERESAES